MSRIGKLPVEIPKGVDVKYAAGTLTVKGSKGVLTLVPHSEMKVVVDESEVRVERPSDEKEHRALHGLTRSLIFNMVEGVTKGFSKTLEIIGVGYRADAKGGGIVLTLGFTGMVMAFHAGQQAPQLGAGQLVGWLVAESICRELGPVLASIVVAARVGSAITAELGTMKVTEQIDALRAMATSPTAYLVVPRVIACLLMVPALTIVADYAGILGGWLFALDADFLTTTMYFTSITSRLALSTAAQGVVKSVFFGLIIAVVGCHQGLYCKMASEDVGRATTRSVVHSILAIFVSDYFLSKILFQE